MKKLILHSLRVQNLPPVVLTVEPGQCVALSGASGVGKTLLLRAIADLDPHEGEVTLGGTACRQLSAPVWRRKVGLLPAESYWWSDRVADHFDDDGEEASALLAVLGLPLAALQWAVSRLSSGEKQRLAILRLLNQHPEALLLDEPTANLDAGSTLMVEKVLADYRQKKQAPVIWVSHDRGQVGRVAQRHFGLHAQGFSEVAL